MLKLWKSKPVSNPLICGAGGVAEKKLRQTRRAKRQETMEKTQQKVVHVFFPTPWYPGKLFVHRKINYFYGSFSISTCMYIYTNRHVYVYIYIDTYIYIYIIY